MSKFEKDEEVCFLVAGDAKFQLGDTPVIREGLGAFIYRVVGRDITESLVALFDADRSQIDFGLVIVAGEELSDHQLVLAQRDVNRALEIGFNLGSDEFRTSDPIFAAIGRAAVALERLEDELRCVLENSVRLPSSIENEKLNRDDAWYYLQVAYDESFLNHDPVFWGDKIGDLSYRPIESGILTFFKVQGVTTAERLVRLFNRAIKPKVERNDDVRFRVTFLYQDVESLDEDEIFLIEEDLSVGKSGGELLDRRWNSTVSSRIGISPGLQQDRPLEGAQFSFQRLYDQARRWSERIGGSRVGSQAEEDPRKEPPPINDDTANENAIPNELIRAGLPTAVIASLGLRDLNRVHTYFPGAIPEEEAKELHETLAASLKSAAKLCRLEEILEIVKVPAWGEYCSDVELTGLMTMLLVHHPDVDFDNFSPDSILQNIDIAITKSHEDALEPARGIIARIHQAMLFDCRVPCPVDDDSFQEPQRFLQMLRAYWEVIQQAILVDIEMPVGYQPNPLLPMVVNFKARIDECFSRLYRIGNAVDIQKDVAELVDILSDGDPDGLSAVPEWSYRQVGKVNRFIEEARLAIGAKSYPLTPPEQVCLGQARKAVHDYEAKIKEEWSRINRRMASTRTTNKNRRSEPQQPSSPTIPANDGKPRQDPKVFEGGELIFSAERVTLCGVEICSGTRQWSRRIVLELLTQRRRNGTFRAFSGEDLETAAKKHGAKGSPSGLIRDLRDNIQIALREHAGIECSRTDVILSGTTGYRLAESLTVQFLDAPLIKDITDTDEDPNVRNKGQQDVPNVYENTAYGRRTWILQKLKEGTRLKVMMVAEQFRVSAKTAQRDLTALKNEGQIEYVGPSRTGFYQLCQDRSSDRESG